MPKKIAIVDDDKRVTHDYSAVFKAAGYQVLSCSSFQDWDSLLSLSGKNAADLFIIDLQMPHGGRYESEVGGNIDYTGFHLAQEVRRKFPARPIIIFSSYPRVMMETMARRVTKGISNAICLDKGQVDEEQLLQQLDFYFRHNKFSRSIWERFREAFIAQPTFAGIGVDLSKLFDLSKR